MYSKLRLLRQLKLGGLDLAGSSTRPGMGKSVFNEAGMEEIDSVN